MLFKFFLLCTVVCIAWGRPSEPTLKDEKNLAELAGSLGATKLVELLKIAKMDKLLETKGPFTIFAPTNEAFEALGDLLELLKTNPDLLGGLLAFHVTNGAILSSQLDNDQLIVPISGERVKTRIRANVYTTPQGQVVTVNGARVTNGNQIASNGVMHLVSGVMFPAVSSIANIAAGDPNLSTLSKYLGTTNLTDMFVSAGSYSLIAPSNAAFAKLPSDLTVYLERNPSVLKQVLLYHASAGTIYSAGVYNGQRVASLNGQTLEVHVRQDGIFINGVARVVGGDADATNGVLHTIDTVLIPSTLV